MAYSHAVCRSAELLSCAKTAVKIAKARGEEWAASAILSLAAQPAEPQRHFQEHHHNSGSAGSALLEDGVTLLRTMDAALEHLDQLVKRRGHTNDPTLEINTTVASLEEDARDMKVWIQQIVPVCTGQRYKHWRAVQEWFQHFTQSQNDHLKRVLEIRANVIAEQAKQSQRIFQRTKRNNITTVSTATTTRPKFQPPPPPPRTFTELNGSSIPNRGVSASVSSSSSFSPTTITASNPDNHHSNTAPLFQSYSNVSSSDPVSSFTNGSTSNGTKSSTSPIRQPVVDPYDASYYYNYNTPSAGYGAGSNMMRQRRGGTQQQQQQLLQQEQVSNNSTIQSQQRAEEAMMVEQTLVSMSQLYGKMSSVIAEQSETLLTIEDDVEAAHMDVIRGQEQIGILYAIKKGNRPLILKTYALLIFFIIVMRFYSR